MIKLLLDNGPDVTATNGQGYTALSVAVKQQENIIVNELLLRGAYPLVGKRSAVHAAIKSEDLDILKELLKNLSARGKCDNKLELSVAWIKEGYSYLACHVPRKPSSGIFLILKELVAHHRRHKYPVPS
jgi:ankyrin repeat protein